MARKVIVWDRDGNRSERDKATPELLREDLRELPSEFVTKDIGDPDKIHELDAPHVQEQIWDDRIDELVNDDKESPVDAKLEGLPPDHEYIPLESVSKERLQWWVDLEKMGTMKALLDSVAAGTVDLDCHFHLWFPKLGPEHGSLAGKREYHNQMIRKGAAPPDWSRPKELKGLDLDITLDRVPDSIRTALSEAGHSLSDFDKLWNDRRYLADNAVGDDEHVASA